MESFRADLHIHSLLSPCASLDMTPQAIVTSALERGLQMIAVTDHNTTLHCELTVAIGREAGLPVLRGVEVTSSEEVHSLVILPDGDARVKFQQWLEDHYIRIPYDPLIFGFQPVIDRDENIITEIEHYLTSSINASLDDIGKMAHCCGGLFLPAHIDRPSFSITSQLGFMPEDLEADAVEITGKEINTGFAAVKNSDAHYPDQIGRRYTTYSLEEPTFEELALALGNKNGRHIISVTP